MNTQPNRRADYGGDFHFRSLLDTLDLHVGKLMGAAERADYYAECVRLQQMASLVRKFAQRLRDKYRDQA